MRRRPPWLDGCLPRAVLAPWGVWSVFGVACSIPVLLLVAASGLILWRWWRIRAAEPMSIAEAARRAGYCEVGGTVEARDAFAHPLAEGPVAWVSLSGDLELDPAERDEGLGRDTERRLLGELGEAIWLRDDTGLARVEPRGATLEVSEPRTLDYDRSSGVEPPAWVRDMAARARPPVDPARVRRARGLASIIQPGDSVHVLGWATAERAGEALYRDAQLVPVFRRGRRRPLLVANVGDAELRTNELGLAVLVLAVAAIVTMAWWGIFGGLW